MKSLCLTGLLIIVQMLTSFAQITNFSPSRIIGGIGQTLTIQGQGFGNSRLSNYVTFLNDSEVNIDSTKAILFKYETWSDTKIVMQMPVAFSGKITVRVNGQALVSGEVLHVDANLGYRQANPLIYDYLNNQNQKGGYTWHMHRTYWENPEAKAAIEDVFREFRCKTGINYVLANEPSDATLTLSDVVNLIAPDVNLGPVGYTDRLWTSCILGAETFYTEKTMDIRMSTKVDWYFGKGAVPANKAKFRYVLMHELGHSAGLGHVNELGQTMYPTVTLLPSDNWSQRDSITSEESMAIAHMVKLSQEFSFRACGILPMSTTVNCQDVYGTTASTHPELYHALEIQMFPNPAKDQLFVRWPARGESPRQFIITDLLGRHILSGMLYKEENEININCLEHGIYFIQIGGTQLEKHKFIKQ